ncbi:recombinase family protein [Pallidibacillus thermolactis]|jgi:Resolvase, N terminal domain|uniref:recombinase family protein n=1 Tax=Pallidibacillus thermolactis TaxID=251051 RepID=UPI0021D8E620|nr:recombinase family protein [Pallidibacillus thermolactis]MCU9601893.1 recombinase family protein [Pallidibacillus thermolactis subsp. kokeshiiformis]
MCSLYSTTNKNLADENLRIQREMIKDFVLKKGWELTCVYSDISSGIDNNRNLKLMIEDVRHGKFDIIVATDPSRLYRNTELLMELEDLNKQNKIHIVTVDNQINTIHSDDDKLLRNFSSFNNVLQQKNMRFPAVYIRTNKPVEEYRYLQYLIPLLEYKKNRRFIEKLHSSKRRIEEYLYKVK